jgi:hypothetical protein
MGPTTKRRFPRGYKVVLAMALLSCVYSLLGISFSRPSFPDPPTLAEPVLSGEMFVVPGQNATRITSNHFSLEETMRILKDLGGNDKYKYASFRCSKDAYREPELYWYDYSSASVPSLIPTRRLLIVQSAGFGTYAQLLESTAPINKAYARKWGHTVLIVQGTLAVLNHERQTNCTPEEHRATHNKMQLLKLALRIGDHYDYLLILDADAIIFDFGVDLSDLMPPSAMLAAQRAVPKAGVKKRATWKINAGVTLWNLHHPYTQAVADGWQDAALGYLNGRSNSQGDQLFLHHVLKNNATYERSIHSFAKEFNYNKGTVIKHVKRPTLTYTIGETALDDRSVLLAKFTEQVCAQFPDDCHDLDKTTYSEL